MTEADTNNFDPLDKPRSVIFKNKRVLEDNYIPDHLVARSKEITRVAELLIGVFQPEAGFPQNGLIFGKTGTGKTVVTKYVLNLFERKVANEGLNVKAVYITCRGLSQQMLYYQMLTKIDPAVHVPTSGISNYHYIRHVFEAMNQANTSVVLVLDEIDQMKNDELLYLISRASVNSDISRDLFFSVIGISNFGGYADTLDPRTVSSLRHTTIVFDPYNASELREILHGRAELAYHENVLDEAVIPYCAGLSAQDHGDARRAVQLLRAAGEAAEKREEMPVQERHVRIGQEDIDTDAIAKIVGTLTFQNKLILKSVVLRLLAYPEERNTTGGVWECYLQLAAEQGVESVARTRFSQHLTELDMLGIIDTHIVRGKEAGRTTGRSRRITTTQSPEKILKIMNGRSDIRPPD